MKRAVIINGDDFGMNRRCSKAIAQAFAEGLITDTTMMANGDYVPMAIKLARESGFVSNIGIHFNLTEGKPLTEDICQCPKFVLNGRFHKNYSWEQPLTAFEQQAVFLELSAQVERLLGEGVVLTHADSHHYIHTAKYLLPPVLRVCRKFGIEKIRLCRNLGDGVDEEYAASVNSEIRRQGFITTSYFGSFRRIGNAEIPESCEILVHPDYDREGVLIDRAGMRDGHPFGKPLNALKAIPFGLTSYALI